MEGVCTLWLFIDKIELWSWWPPFQHKPIILLFDKWLRFFKRLFEVQSTNTVSVILSCSLWEKNNYALSSGNFVKATSIHVATMPVVHLPLTSDWVRALSEGAIYSLWCYCNCNFISRTFIWVGKQVSSAASSFCRFGFVKRVWSFVISKRSFVLWEWKVVIHFWRSRAKKEKGSQ